MYNRHLKFPAVEHAVPQLLRAFHTGERRHRWWVQSIIGPPHVRIQNTDTGTGSKESAAMSSSDLSVQSGTYYCPICLLRAVQASCLSKAGAPTAASRLRSLPSQSRKPPQPAGRAPFVCSRLLRSAGAWPVQLTQSRHVRDIRTHFPDRQEPPAARFRVTRTPGWAPTPLGSKSGKGSPT